MLRTRSNTFFFFSTKGQVTPKWIVQSSRNSNSSEILCLSRLSESLEHEGPIYTRISNMAFFGIQGQVTPRWKVRSDLNSNLSEILWLSWLPASLQKIQSKVNALYSLHFLHLWENFSSLKGELLQSKQNNHAWNQTRPRLYGCPRYLQVWRSSDKKWSHCPPDNIFPIVSLWKLSIAMETSVWSNLRKNLMQHFPHPSDATYKIWSRLASLPQRYSSSKVWTDNGWTDQAHLVSLRLSWTKNI